MMTQILNLNMVLFNFVDVKPVTYLGCPSPIAVSYDSQGRMAMQLPQGPPYDSYKVNLFVQIVDDGDGVTVFNITDPVYVHPNSELTNMMMDDILYNPVSSFLNILKTGTLQGVSQQLASFTSMLNMQALSAADAQGANTSTPSVSH